MTRTDLLALIPLVPASALTISGADMPSVLSRSALLESLNNPQGAPIEHLIRVPLQPGQTCALAIHFVPLCVIDDTPAVK